SPSPPRPRRSWASPPASPRVGVTASVARRQGGKHDAPPPPLPYFVAMRLHAGRTARRNGDYRRTRRAAAAGAPAGAHARGAGEVPFRRAANVLLRPSLRHRSQAFPDVILEQRPAHAALARAASRSELHAGGS